MGLEGLDNSFGCIAAVNVRGNELEECLQFFFNLEVVCGAVFLSSICRLTLCPFFWRRDMMGFAAARR